MKYSTASLQDLCLREVIKYLEYYPPELLTCLPPTLRRRLLVHMPIVDLCQLENTCVFDGVDAEIVWKERYEQQTTKYTKLIANEYSATFCGLTLDHDCIVNKPDRLLSRYPSMREKYFALIFYSIFDCARPTGYYQSDLHWNIATFGDIDLNKYGLIDHPVDVVNYLVSAAKIDRVLLAREPSDETYSNPKKIYFENPIPEYELSKSVSLVKPLNHYAYMNANSLYQEVPPRYSSYLNRGNHFHLSDEDALMLLMEKCGYYTGDVYINVLRCGAVRWNWEDDKIKSLIGRFFSKVFKLELCCHSDNLETVGQLKYIMEAILSSSSLQLFSLTISDANDDHINTLVPLLSSPSAPCRLEELRLDYATLDLTSSADTFAHILAFQSNVTSLHVNGLDCPVDGEPFVHNIMFLLQRPNFKHLSLRDVILPSEVVQTLITTFLTTPCSQAQTVQLHISLVESASSGFGRKLDIPESALEYKSLDVCTLTACDIKSWLLSLQPIKLKSLSISSDTLVKNVNRSLLALAAHHISLYVRHLNLERTDFSTEDFLLLLQNKTLKELTIVPSSRVDLSDITHGLVKIGEIGNLEKLVVNGFIPISPHCVFNCVKLSSTVEVEQFGETIFTLPHLSCFSLELSIEFDQSLDAKDFVESLFKIWERKSKKPRCKKFALNFLSRTMKLPQFDVNMKTMTEDMGMEVNMRHCSFV